MTDITTLAVGDDEWSSDMQVFRVVPANGDEGEYDGEILGAGVSFPESGVYVDWHTSAFPDELNEPHVSEYGSIADLRKATGNDVVDLMPPRETPTEQAAFADYEDFDACVAANSDKDDPEAYCASIKRTVEGEADALRDDWEDRLVQEDDPCWEGYTMVGMQDDGTPRCVPAEDVDNYDPDASQSAAVEGKAEFAEGDAVTWDWQGEPVHGRVAAVDEERYTPPNADSPITALEDGVVYVIDEWDDDVGAYRRENVAKPSTAPSLDVSTKDLPPRSDEHYAAADVLAAVLADHVTPVSASAFTPPELDHMAVAMDGLLRSPRPNEWAIADGTLAYRATIPDQYLDGRSEELFVPNAGVAEAARKVTDWREEHGADAVAGGAADGEGTQRATQLIEYHERGEPLAIEYWEEIENYHDRHHSQGTHELDADSEGEPWTDAGYVSHLNWGGDPGYEQAQRVMDAVREVDQEVAIEMRGAVATEQSVSPANFTEGDTNKVDLEALDGELREAVEADDFYLYGKASIEQWDDDTPPTYIQMDALEAALDRYFDSERAPGIISRHHQDIPVGTPVREFEFAADTALEIGGETYEFAAGDTARSHVEDADGDGRPELWLAATIDGETEMGKKTRVLAAQGDLNGFSVTVHRNDDEMTQEGRVVTECDLHAVTIGTDEQIKNPGSEFDVAGFKSVVGAVRRRIAGVLRG